VVVVVVVGVVLVVVVVLLLLLLINDKISFFCLLDKTLSLPVLKRQPGEPRPGRVIRKRCEIKTVTPLRYEFVV